MILDEMKKKRWLDEGGIPTEMETGTKEMTTMHVLTENLDLKNIRI